MMAEEAGISASDEKPTVKEASLYIKPYVKQWFEIGLLLDIKFQKLEEIGQRHDNDEQSCGPRMLMEWLISDPNACWGKLKEAVANVSKNANMTASSTESGQATPQPGELHSRIVPVWAPKWRELGEALGLSVGKLDIISENHNYHPRRCEECCKVVLKTWLERDVTASWNKLDEAISSISSTVMHVESIKKGKDPVPDHVKDIYVVRRYKASTKEDEWPPEQPQHFTSVTIIYHRRSRNKREILAVAGVKKSGFLQDDNASREYLAQSKLTKNISEIFKPLEDTDMKPPQSILIEGAPGIGKTILSKEIAYQWAIGNKEILQDKKLVFLIFMRDPAVAQMKSIEDIVHSFYQNDPGAKDIAVSCGKYLLDTEGRELAIILDGYDELSEKLRNASLFSDIINQKVLPKCLLVITSRPSASARLHNNMERRMEILGFSEADRKKYIQDALKGLQDQIQGLLEFLASHPTIDSLCYIPLNMTILLYLMKQSELSMLPTSQTNLYQVFVCLTICHHLKKNGVTLEDTEYENLRSFPDPYYTVIHKLAKLSYSALGESKLVFTLAEIREACPKIDSNPGAMNGFGLLQAVEHYSMSHTTRSFNFVHFSIQEYLAAFYISLLEGDEELKALQDTFWTGSHHNTWVIYIGITKGQKEAFKKFLCGGKPDASTISPELLETSRKCLHLFECFDEAGDYKMCQQIDRAQIFNGRINTSMRTLTPMELKSLSIFLTKTSIKQWNELSLSSCIIGDTGCSTLEAALSRSAPTIESIRLEDNQLSALSTDKVVKIAMYCNTVLLDLRWNELQDGEWTSLVQNRSLTSIVLDECNLQVVGTKNLVAAVAENKTLTGLRLDRNEITDEAAEALASVLAKNTSLTNLRLCRNPLTEKGVTLILQSLYSNTVLEWLWLPNHFSDSVEEGLRKQEDNINDHRLNNKCYVKLTMMFSS